MLKKITEDELRKKVIAVVRKAGSSYKAAEALGIGSSHIRVVMTGKNIPDALARCFGYTRRVIRIIEYIEIEEGSGDRGVAARPVEVKDYRRWGKKKPAPMEVDELEKPKGVIIE